MIYRLDAGALPNGREHFGFRDGIGGPHIIGSTDQPRPGQDEVMPGEFIYGYEDELGNLAAGPTPDVLARNGTYLALRQLHTTSRAFVAICGTTPAHPRTRSCSPRRWSAGGAAEHRSHCRRSTTIRSSQPTHNATTTSATTTTISTGFGCR